MASVKFFRRYAEMEAWINNHPEGIIVSDKTPLLANLTMKENIALIDEVHRLMPVQESQQRASSLLAKLNLTTIEEKRVGTCSDLELFATMLLRAERMPREAIYIVLPLLLLGHADAIEQTLALLTLLDSQKDIFILELTSNRVHYQGQACHISD
ncbi:MAG: hypothetical protein CO158_07725 [Piscirickettsiaceae bacterium CG_4_9_14_3_um_filter_43_564]|nr:hypothetical protein [Thiomicrospira sp.]OIP93825.1 MAG: hypothetical protein AUK56_10715 [Thiomicrospira sp. CG2_30_44_34]PIQ06438.1 MAG: hypothetical protein COW74_00655 [Piscirickettsiaceae bacterium CG18_big_fil_WC_8_21_14_2_50_44_103]PIU37819.1 MAG: hypothetical protein COT01_09580 [Piscirickettsiaceae bacterium CG07_land_8_20_14_0_80_44_28]PIW57192.1 MAG: hypothetical protein COW14_07100 [Piscirickettsiaceae bacterium CG12_big_fil_rev_8_21_14_0_65_44_934]PIW77957.1 MAG: hypothetical p